ncbi:MAG: PRC-barrel domain containing protein [Collinsella sp.]|nr:PRC-barrel domain containing protein [Collinsella sp.]
MRVGDFQGVRIHRLPAEGKRAKGDGAPQDLKRLGKIHFPVFSPDGRRVVGFMVKLPDIAGMIKQEDRFVALDAVDVRDDLLVVADHKASYDEAAARRLGIDLDSCIIWTGMDAVTESGTRIGYCVDAECHPRTGVASAFVLTPSAASSALLGNIEMPVSYLRGYRHGAMIVSDEALEISFSGGAAAKAAEATVKVGEGVKKGARALDEKGSVAVERGGRALGKRLGETGEAFRGFSDEYRRASGSAAKAPKSGSASKALGKQVGKATGMFQAFASEFKKASGSSKGRGSKR